MARFSTLVALLLGRATAQMDSVGMMMAFMQEQMEAAHAEMAAAPSTVQVPAPTCAECVESMAVRMLEATTDKMRAKCAAGQGCPHACRRLEEDPLVMMGVLTVRSRPVNMASNFCTGRGLCAPGEVSQSAALKAGTLMHLAHAAEQDLAAAIQGVEQEEGPMEKPAEGRKGWKSLMPPVDPKCVETTINQVMEKVDGMAAKACKERQVGVELIKGLPVGGGACELRATRPEFFHGMLVGKVEPWKFAKGYCMPHEQAAEPMASAFNWVKSAVSALQQRVHGMREHHDEHEHGFKHGFEHGEGHHHGEHKHGFEHGFEHGEGHHHHHEHEHEHGFKHGFEHGDGHHHGEHKHGFEHGFEHSEGHHHHHEHEHEHGFKHGFEHGEGHHHHHHHEHGHEHGFEHGQGHHHDEHEHRFEHGFEHEEGRHWHKHGLEQGFEHGFEHGHSHHHGEHKQEGEDGLFGGRPCPHHEKMMKEVWACHRQCGHDVACHEKCPEPFAHLAHACAARNSAKECLAGCNGGFSCHLGCLSPMSVPRVAHVVSSFACGAWCRNDEACKQRCFMEPPRMEEKCARLSMVKECHHSCAHGDFGCHMQCPKMFEHHHHHHMHDSQVDGHQTVMAVPMRRGPVMPARQDEMPVISV